MSITAIAVNPANPQEFTVVHPQSVAPGEYDLLVEVKAASVNPVDTKVRAGLIQNGLTQPRILGWDASGVVLTVGAKVSGFKAGDEVWYAGDITRAGSNSTQQVIDSRLVAHKPKSLNWAEAAAIPLTALTAWEGLFERLNLHNATAQHTLLIIGGAGGVGSLAISLAALRSDVKVIATASNPASAAWCKARGADLTVDWHDLKGGLAQHGIKQVDYIFCLNDTDGHWDAISDLIAPQGQICTIVENTRPLNQSVLKSKSAALHWEFMFTRSMFNTPDIAQQGEILQQMAQLFDEGKIEGTLSETLNGLSVENLTRAHEKVAEGRMRGKIVIAY
ncbi:zinc-binding alcohol dehydrogenase family protein [Enterobacillus tribolii]|uniref:Zinc-type alcohol dehydrogenase-like protein n=1 Tax=Enterobacillus tribolii TaxID=1487935 RepID=A0A370QQ54_9GAMM|nr:zinc-binding alcohol dehydrogenase family protein [Enterobacillus tribolii]MBW7981534.1 zinc-binding alcohol dehydrogenase family protein [Enterobacillus tribolii]RDK90911.1 zinc-binding alcohol dehydrogenase family protein [Enterobacillus tribolii]